MAQITLRGNPCNTVGELPQVGEKAPDFTLVDQDLANVSLQDFAGKRKLISIVPSLDTPTCAVSTQHFSQAVNDADNAVLLVVSADLPFAQKRFCTATNTSTAVTLSTFRSTFPVDYGIEIIDGPFTGISGRAVVILDETDKVIYTELVAEIAQEPDYDAAMKHL